MRLEHHLVGGYVRYISPHIIIIINVDFTIENSFLHSNWNLFPLYLKWQPLSQTEHISRED